MHAAPLLWDVFCRVIDNHGDLGLCWRLARQLAASGQRVRLWVDDARALAWMAPGALQGGFDGIRVHAWTQPIACAALAGLPRADVWVEAFGCDIAPEFIAHFAHPDCEDGLPKPALPVWINLEYLSAEPWVPRMHALPSPVLQGAAAGWTKWFFYPGFGPGTGGLLREADLPARQAAFDRAGWLATQGLARPARLDGLDGLDEPGGPGGPDGQDELHGLDGPGGLVASLFCYEPPALPALLAHWRHGAQPVHLLVTAGRAAAAVRACLQDAASQGVAGPGGGAAKGPHRTSGGAGALSLSYLPHLPQTAYDELLWACGLNFVRGEDSLVRALWAGRPFVWHIYPQPEDNAHHAKLAAFLHWLDAPPTLRRFHLAWNGVTAGPLPALDPRTLASWRACVQAARARLLAQPGLCAQLLAFVAAKRGQGRASG